MKELNYPAIRRRSEQRTCSMRTEFDSIKGTLREIAKNVLPSAVRGLDENVENYSHRAKDSGNEDNVCLIPIEALRKGASGFLVNLMNPARKWYKLSVTKEAAQYLGGEEQANALCEYIQGIVDECMHSSGAYIDFKRMFECLLAFGFAGAVVRKDETYGAKIECLRIGTFALGADYNGKIVRMYRRFAMTPEEIVREFGKGADGRSRIPERVMAAWRRGDVSDAANVVVCNLIEPNEETYAIGSDDVLDYGISKGLAYRSIYWIEGYGGKCEKDVKDADGVLDIRGFAYNPIIAPRLSSERGDIYGRGRGHDALNACRAIQALRMDELEISSNRAEPPLIASNDLREEGLGLGRGEITYANIGEQRSEMVIPVLPNPPTSDETRQTLTELTQEVRACFFNDEFATIDSLKLVGGDTKRTAAEINALTSENMLLLAGIILMLDHELLDPVVKAFTSRVLENTNLVGGIQIPEGALSIKYVSNLHTAQLAQEINSVEASVARAANIAGLGSPRTAGALDHFDFDMIIRRLHTLVGAGQEYLIPMEKVMEERQAAAEAAAEAQAQAQAQQQAELELERAKAAAQNGRAAEAEMNAQQMLGEPAAQLGGYV